METVSQEFIQMVVKDLEDHFSDEPNHMMSLSNHREPSLLARSQTRPTISTQSPIMEDDDDDDDLENSEKDSENDSIDEYDPKNMIFQTTQPTHHIYQPNLRHIVLENVETELIIEEKVDENNDEIILVPNSLLKHEIIEGEEVIVGSDSTMRLTDIDDELNHLNSNLIIDTPMKDELTGYDCGECGTVLKSRNQLKKHIAKHHDTEIYHCSSCTYQTARRDKLDKHIAKHLAEGYSPVGRKRSNKGVPPQRMRHAAEEYKCPMCPYRCTVEKAIKKHMKLHQGGGKHFAVKVSCKICGKDRSSETDLRKHMKKHKEDRDFVCDVCGFSSIQLKKIIQHRRMHTGEKPHLCPHCAYRSARRDNLRSHVRRMHKKENMYIDTFNPRAEQPE